MNMNITPDRETEHYKRLSSLPNGEAGRNNLHSNNPDVVPDQQNTLSDGKSVSNTTSDIIKLVSNILKPTELHRLSKVEDNNSIQPRITTPTSNPKINKDNIILNVLTNEESIRQSLLDQNNGNAKQASKISNSAINTLSNRSRSADSTENDIHSSDGSVTSSSKKRRMKDISPREIKKLKSNKN